MRFACVDKSASDRLKLKELLESSFEFCRDSIGHLASLEFIPATQEEILLNQTGVSPKKVASASPTLKRIDLQAEAYAGIILGSGYSVEESISALSSIRQSEELIPVFLFLSPENFSIRILRRVEKYNVDVFRTDESQTRIAHSLLKSSLSSKKNSSGKIIAVEGAKGGVGVTSLTAGLAHAASAIGRSAVVVDFSSEGALFQYLQSEKWQSADFRTLLLDKLSPNKLTIERSLTRAPNGINLLLPPAGGKEIRELWLRNNETLEISLSILEILKESFDLVLCDMGHAEGVLSFSVLSRADVRLLISSNEPASVHLLHEKLAEFDELPGNARTVVCVNLLVENSLTFSDIEDYLLSSSAAESVELVCLPKDLNAANWIGTGNTIYTEGSKRFQETLRGLTSSLSAGTKISAPLEKEPQRKKLLSFFNFRKTGALSSRGLLPAPNADLESVNFVLGGETRTDSSRNEQTSCSFSSQSYVSPQIVSQKVRAAGG